MNEKVWGDYDRESLRAAYDARGSVAYGPYNARGFAEAYNPRTGTYARGGFAYGPYQAGGWASAYNPRTGSFAATRQGANTYSSWGSSVVKRGNDWARTARYSDSRGSVAGLRTSEGGAAGRRRSAPAPGSDRRSARRRGIEPGRPPAVWIGAPSTS